MSRAEHEWSRIWANMNGAHHEREQGCTWARSYKCRLQNFTEQTNRQKRSELESGTPTKNILHSNNLVYIVYFWTPCTRKFKKFSLYLYWIQINGKSLSHIYQLYHNKHAWLVIIISQLKQLNILNDKLPTTTVKHWTDKYDK